LLKKYDIDKLIEDFKKGNKIALARLITLVENNPEKAPEIFRHFENINYEAYIIGITGSPGVGKSTLTNAITRDLLSKGKKVGIISVDPTSPFSGGAFLGDRVRMTEISLHPNAYIRSLASRGYRGGISKAVLDITLLYEAFGMDIIIIETVGVGQSEFDIYNLAYTIIVVMIPGYGDSVQMKKAGILEIGDIYVVNKKDFGGEDIAAQIDSMLDDTTLQSGWRPTITMTNAITGDGVGELMENIYDHKEYMELSELLQKKKKIRFAYKIRELLYHKIDSVLESLIDQEELNDITSKALNNKFQIYELVHDVFSDIIFERKSKK